MKRKTVEEIITFNLEDWGSPNFAIAQIKEFVKLYEENNPKDIFFHEKDFGGYDGPYYGKTGLYFYRKRPETDEEMEMRIKHEKNMAKQRKEWAKQRKDAELKEYLRLKKKFDKSKQT